MFRRLTTLLSLSTALLAAAFSVSATADNGFVGTSAPVAINTAPVAKFLPVSSWNVNVAGGQAALGHKAGATSGDSRKAATDLITVFRPLAGCRLYDSRNGNPSALGVLGGSWFSGNKRTMVAGGQCGIPSTGVAGLSLAMNVFNYSAPSTGRIAMMPVGQPITGNQTGFTSAQWFWTAANVKTSSNASFDTQILDITAELIIDINGYYQDADTVDSATQLDINYSLSGGDAFQVAATAGSGTARAITANSSSAAGTALQLNNNAGGNAIAVNSGKFTVAGAGVGTGGFVFQFSTNTAGTASAGTGTGCFAGASDIHVITHPMTDNNPGALLFITPKFSSGGLGDGAHTATAPYRAIYLTPTSCGGGTGQNKWAIQDMSLASMANAAKFNIMVITP